ICDELAGAGDDNILTGVEVNEAPLTAGRCVDLAVDLDGSAVRRQLHVMGRNGRTGGEVEIPSVHPVVPLFGEPTRFEPLVQRIEIRERPGLYRKRPCHEAGIAGPREGTGQIGIPASLNVDESRVGSPCSGDGYLRSGVDVEVPTGLQ